MKGWKTALALGAAAAAAGAVAGEYFYRFALTQQIDKTAAFNAPHNRPTGAPRGTLAADREWLNAQPHEDWWLTSGDGLQLHALCVRAGGNAPWAVLCHGQSEGRYIGMGWPERRDIAAWVQRVTAENGAPDIVLMGVSMGAATVMMTAGEPLPPNVRAIVEDCGYTTAWEEFRYQLKKTYGLPPFPVLYTADALLRRRAGFSLREASAAAQVAHSRTPMLFIHGGKDAFVPFAMLDEVYAAARCPKEKYVEPDAGHAESLRMAPARYWAKVFGFIGRWMPLPGAERTVAADPAEKPV